MVINVEYIIIQYFITELANLTKVIIKIKVIAMIIIDNDYIRMSIDFINFIGIIIVDSMQITIKNLKIMVITMIIVRIAGPITATIILVG